MTTRTWLSFASAALLSLSVAACGEDTTEVDPCASGEPSHACGAGAFDLTEGGEYRLELIEARADVDGDGVIDDASVLAGQAFFFTGQAAPRGLDGVPIDTTGIANVIGCGDYTDGNFFDNGATEGGQAIADARTYFDVGSELTLTGGANDIVLARAENQADPSAGLQHDVVYVNTDPSLLTFNTFYTPQLLFGAEADIPGLDLADGVAVTGEQWAADGGDVVVYVPPQFAFTSLNGQPLDDDTYLEQGVLLQPGMDNTFEWTNEEAPDGTAPTNMAFVGFFDVNGRVDYYCFNPDGQADGQLTIPAEVVDRADQLGGLLIGKFTHMAWANVQDDTRIDFLGVTCKFAPYQKAQP